MLQIKIQKQPKITLFSGLLFPSKILQSDAKTINKKASKYGRSKES